ncbi:alpha/beta fold hydrolase [Paracoccus litorisediminis]|uniref:Alpha/beta fold hydrolase n=1 Tax=Paracoccus litorisediminis TaxID=2006130 RepID=A0A844HTE8_9RHOB|nr:alpha/beta hydrolase [Paracoccus litorisediminis]MTH61597.1 alpha/beta fold hydrolase [Paracoccus litorisediminis]
MAVVLIPGFMLDRDLWHDVEPALAGFGPLIHSDPTQGASIADMARNTLGMAPARFALIGFSMGGYVAREMVYLAQDRVTHLVLIATSARGDDQVQQRRKAAVAGADPALFRGLSRASIRQSVHPDREQDADLIDRIHKMSVRLGGETFRRQALFQREGDAARLAEIRCPTLIVAGREDRLRSLDEAEELHRGVAGSQIEMLEAGHMIPMEAPQDLSDRLVRFLSD